MKRYLATTFPITLSAGRYAPVFPFPACVVVDTGQSSCYGNLRETALPGPGPSAAISERRMSRISSSDMVSGETGFAGAVPSVMLSGFTTRFVSQET